MGSENVSSHESAEAPHGGFLWDLHRGDQQDRKEAKPDGKDASLVVSVLVGFDENNGLLRRGIRRRIRNRKGFGFSPNKSLVMVDPGVRCSGLADGFQRRRRVSMVLPEEFQRQWFQEGFFRRRRASPEGEEVRQRRFGALMAIRFRGFSVMKI
ncbi:hypothetical protein U1Q18_043868 [Sarracenia purpurea var. burkii]